MSIYKIAFENDGYPAKASHEIEISPKMIRQYTTVVNTAIALVLAKADVLLIDAEDGTIDVDTFLAKGLDLKVE